MMNETLHYLKGLVRPFSREYRRNCRLYPKARPISYEAWLEIKRNHWATFFHADDGRELPGQDRAAYCKVRAGAYVRMTDKGLSALVEEFDRRLALSVLDQAQPRPLMTPRRCVQPCVGS